MKRGIIFSFDALIAAFIIFFMLLTATAYIAGIKFEGHRQLQLREFGDDAIAVLEKSGELEYAVQNDRVNRIRKYLNQLPQAYCAEVKVYPTEDLNNADFVVRRPLCRKDFTEYTSSKRVFIVNNDDANICVAEMNVWHRK